MISLIFNILFFISGSHVIRQWTSNGHQTKGNISNVSRLQGRIRFVIGATYYCLILVVPVMHIRYSNCKI